MVYREGHLLPHRLCDPVGACQVEPDFGLGVHCREREGARVTETLGHPQHPGGWCPPDSEPQGGETPTRDAPVLCELGETNLAVE